MNEDDITFEEADRISLSEIAARIASHELFTCPENSSDGIPDYPHGHFRYRVRIHPPRTADVPHTSQKPITVATWIKDPADNSETLEIMFERRAFAEGGLPAVYLVWTCQDHLTASKPATSE